MLVSPATLSVLDAKIAKPPPLPSAVFMLTKTFPCSDIFEDISAYNPLLWTELELK